MGGQREKGGVRCFEEGGVERTVRSEMERSAGKVLEKAVWGEGCSLDACMWRLMACVCFG